MHGAGRNEGSIDLSTKKIVRGEIRAFRRVKRSGGQEMGLSPFTKEQIIPALKEAEAGDEGEGDIAEAVPHFNSDASLRAGVIQEGIERFQYFRWDEAAMHGLQIFREISKCGC